MRGSQRDFHRWSTDPGEKIANGEIVHYTRRDPETSEVTERFAWRRSAAPQDESGSQPWSAIGLRRYDASGLMAAVEEGSEIAHRPTPQAPERD
jgi:hypothetical protein